MPVNPLDDRVLVKLFDAEEVTPGGIVLPDVAKERPHKGEVIAVGPGRVLDNGERIAVAVGVGDSIVFAKYSGAELKIDGKTHIVLRESDVLAVIGK